MLNSGYFALHLEKGILASVARSGTSGLFSVVFGAVFTKSGWRTAFADKALQSQRRRVNDGIFAHRV